MPWPGVRSVVFVALTGWASLALGQKAELPLTHAPQPTVAAITPADLMTRLYIFADDSMMGREVGTPYHLRATAYIAEQLREIGLTPGGDDGTFFQNIPVFEHPLAKGNTLSVEGKAFAAPADYLPRDNGVFGKVRGLDGVEAIYGGVYGDTATMVKPAAAGGKLVVMLVPKGADGQPIWGGNRQQLTGYYLAAAGVAVVSLDAVDSAARAELLVPAQTFKGDDSDAPTVPAFVYVSRAMGEGIMGAPLAGLTRGAAGRTIHGSLKWDDVPAPGRNVVGILRGSDAALRGQFVALGAHNDHIGFNAEPADHDSLRAFNSIVRPRGEDDPDRPATSEENAKIRVILDSLRKIHPARLDSIYNGADDDGTGSMALLEIAESFAKGPEKPKRSLVFVWHAGEEKGLWGSEYFTDHPTVPRDSIVAQLNMDMIGRGGAQDERGGGPGYLQLIGSRRLSTELGDLVEAVAATEPTKFHFDYQYDANGHPQQYYCRSDHYEYARYGIPITFFSTGGHRDYHQVTDEPQYIDYDQLTRVARLVRDVALRVADLDHRVVVDKAKPNPRAQCVQ
jgi:Peptidase family M28